MGLRLLLTILVCIFFNAALFSQAFFSSKSSGRWNSPATWNLESGTSATNIPGVADSVIISTGHQVRVDSLHQCLSLSVRQYGELMLDSITSLLTVINNLSVTDAGEIIVASGNLTVSGNTAINLGTLSQTGGVISMVGLVNITNTNLFSSNSIVDLQEGIFTTIGGITLTSIARPAELNIGTGIVNVFGALVAIGGTSKLRFLGDGTLVLGGLVTLTNTNFSAGNGRVVYVGIPGVNQNVASLNYNRLVITGVGAGRKIISGTVNVSDTLTLLTDTLQINSGTLTMANNATIIRTEGKLISTPRFSGSVDLIYNNIQNDTTGAELPAGEQTLRNLTIANAGGIVLDKHAYVNQKIILTAGELNTGNYTLYIRNQQGGFTQDPAVEQTAGYVTGLIERSMSASTGIRLFPFGAGLPSSNRSFELNYTTAPTVAGALQVKYFNTAADQQLGLPLTDESVGLVGTTPFYWRADAVGGLSGGEYTLKLTAENITGIEDYLSLRILKRSGAGTAWQLDGRAGLNTGNNLTPIVIRTGMSGFSDFTIGISELATTSVDDIFIRNQALIYPNPLQNGTLLNIGLKHAQGQKCTLILIDLQGREVIRKSWTIGRTDYQLSLPAFIPEGIYKVIIRQGILQSTHTLQLR